MSFWNNVKSQPKLSFKWYAIIGSNINPVQTYTVRSFQRPSFSIASAEYIWLNDVGYRPGVLSWNPIEINLTDGENTKLNNTKILYDMLKQSGYQTEYAQKPKSAIEKAKSKRALGEAIMLIQIDAEDNQIENWTLFNPFLENVNFGQANYAAEEIVTLTLTVRYDYAEHELLREIK